jgi:hypothetical protein
VLLALLQDDAKNQASYLAKQSLMPVGRRAPRNHKNARSALECGGLRPPCSFEIHTDQQAKQGRSASQEPSMNLGRKAASSRRTPRGMCVASSGGVAPGYYLVPLQGTKKRAARTPALRRIAFGRQAAFVVRVFSAPSWGDQVRARGPEGMLTRSTIKPSVGWREWPPRDDFRPRRRGQPMRGSGGSADLRF